MAELMIAHKNRRTREQLGEIVTPPATDTHRPVSHKLAADLTVKYAQEFGYKIQTEEFGISNDGSQMFGVLRLASKAEMDFSRAIGIRNSHNKTLTFALTAGASVMVCSNLCFGGECMVKRKHTSGINPEAIIPEIFMDLDTQYMKLEDNIERMKKTRLTVNKARQKAVLAAEKDIIPSCDIVPVVDQYINPIHADFAAKNEWSFYNCFNEIAKKYSPVRADKTYRGLASFFKLN
jgi:hypothetical protein